MNDVIRTSNEQAFRALLLEWMRACPNPPEWHWSFDLHIRTVNTLGERPSSETYDQSSDGPCQDSDGCPTELAVLKRFWRERHALIPPDGPMPSGCAHQWKYFETVETLRGGCGFERCEHCGTERVANSRRSQKADERRVSKLAGPPCTPPDPDTTAA